MIRFLSVLLLLLSGSQLYAQNSEWMASANRYQDSLNAVFMDPERTILIKEDFEKFEGLNFYPVDLKYRVEARFVRTPDEQPFKMATTTNRKPLYVKYAEAYFSIDDIEYKLDVYKSMSSFNSEEYKDYLFLPFTDLTSGDGSYGGGRYADVRIPEGDLLIIDFNKVYNPYCAYNEGYSCPIVPRVNDLPIRIEAGVKDFKH